MNENPAQEPQVKKGEHDSFCSCLSSLSSDLSVGKCLQQSSWKLLLTVFLLILGTQQGNRDVAITRIINMKLNDFNNTKLMN